MKIILGIIAVIIVIALFAALELWTQVGRYQAYWDKQNQQPSVNNEILYVALGDSTAQGIGASQPQKGYVGLIAAELQQRKTGQHVRIQNFSKTGAKISDVIDRQLPLLEKVNISEQDVVTIEIGANDMADFDASRFERQIDELMGKLPPQTIISDIPYFGGGLHKRLEPNVRQANEIMYRLAAKHTFKLAPLHSKIRENHNILRNYAADRFHPSNNSYSTQWAPVFLEQLE